MVEVGMAKRIAEWGRIAAVAGIALLGGVIAPVVGAAADELSASPGDMVDLNGHRLHLLCRGSGSPTVALDAGAGGFSLDWALVMPALARETRVCAYDRAGLGWSEPGPEPRDAAQTVDELGRLLDRAGILPPYVLVGHSAGGLRMQLFTLEHPEQVVGLVLVDSTNDLVVAEQLDMLSPETRRAFEAWLRSPEFGAEPPPPDLDAAALIPLIPPELLPQLAAYVALIARPSHQQAVAAEDAALTASRFQVREAKRAREPQPFGALPLIVLINAIPGTVASLAEPPTAQVHVRLAVEHELAAHLAGLSSRGTLVRAERSGHYIQLDEPDVVVSAIRAVIDAARAPKGG
jgi:pimeloyl-ACP methyl ester carboxylesterase